MGGGGGGGQGSARAGLRLIQYAPLGIAATAFVSQPSAIPSFRWRHTGETKLWTATRALRWWDALQQRRRLAGQKKVEEGEGERLLLNNGAVRVHVHTDIEGGKAGMLPEDKPVS